LRELQTRVSGVYTPLAKQDVGTGDFTSNNSIMVDWFKSNLLLDFETLFEVGKRGQRRQFKENIR